MKRTAAQRLLRALHREPARDKEPNSRQEVNEEPEDLGLDEVGVPEALNALIDGTYITDNERRIRFWSDAAASITGWPANEVLGRSCSEGILVHVDGAGHELCGSPQCPLQRAVSTGERTVQPRLVFARHKQGHRIPVEVSVAPLCDRSGRQVGAVEVFRELSRAVEDLRRAKIIQDYILDWHVPADRRVWFEVRSRPEEVVGGDFHRVQVLGPDQYAIMLADAMGHGVISALYTVHLRSAWDDCQGKLASPAAFFQQLNQTLHRLAGPEGYFATAVYLVLDASTGRVRYVRAGHPAPLVFRGNGEVETLKGRSPALGLLETAEFQEGEATLEPGDQVLLFTDGALELANAAGEMLGEEGLRHLIQNQAEPRLELGKIEKALLDFVHPAAPSDDMTLLTFRFLGPGAT